MAGPIVTLSAVSPFYVESSLRFQYDGLFDDFLRNNAPKFEGFAASRNRILISGKGYEVSLFVSHVEYVRLLEDAVKLLLAKIGVSQESFVHACNMCVAADDAPVIHLMRRLTEYQDFDSYAEMMEGVYNRQVASRESTVVSAPLSAAHTPNKATAMSKAVRVLWDLENVAVAKKAGFATITALTSFLKSRGLFGSGIDCRITAFFTMGKVSKGVIVDLDRAAVELVWVATKREDADRKLGTRIAQEMAVLPSESTTVVVISSDQDFRTYLQQLTRAGFKAICMHDAPEGNWRRALEMHATESFVWKDVMTEFMTLGSSPPSPTASVDGDSPKKKASLGAGAAGAAAETEPVPPGYAKVLVMTTKKSKFSTMLLPVEVLAGHMTGTIWAWHGAFGFAAASVALLPAQVPTKGHPLVASVHLGEEDESQEIKVRVYVHHSILSAEQPILSKGQQVRMDVELGERGCFARTLQVVAT